MTLQQLQHLLRASAEIVGDNQFIVIGSQSILGKFPSAPADLLWSIEADLIAKNKPAKTSKLETIGELSDFHTTHGIYADPVAVNTAILAKGWKGRLVNVVASSGQGKDVTGLCLDPHDLFVSKVAAGRDKDMDFVRVMIDYRMVDYDRVLQLAATVPNPVNDLALSSRTVERINRLYASVPEHQRDHINVASGKYMGAIVGVSETVVQQMTNVDEIVFHQVKQVDQVPAMGDLCTVHYRSGRANVFTHKPGQPAPSNFAVLSISDTAGSAFVELGRAGETAQVLIGAAESLRLGQMPPFLLQDTNGNDVGTFGLASASLAAAQAAQQGTDQVLLQMDLNKLPAQDDWQGQIAGALETVAQVLAEAPTGQHAVNVTVQGLEIGKLVIHETPGPEPAPPVCADLANR